MPYRLSQCFEVAPHRATFGAGHRDMCPRGGSLVSLEHRVTLLCVPIAESSLILVIGPSTLLASDR